jgi:branched-chain amino acid transport system ATP-binding protein
VTPVLETQGLTKRFEGLIAVDNVSVSIEPGGIIGLIGPNGAGKTTLFSLISGFERPSLGHILFRGEAVTDLAPDRRAALGIARTFQIVQPFTRLSVAENIAVGAHLRHRSRAVALVKARDIAARLGLEPMLDKPAASLTVAARKRLELARALATEPVLLLLDEVLAGLNPSEMRDIIPMIRAIRDDGVTVIMVEHVMQAVMNLCERVVVLNQGRMIADGSPPEVTRDRRVVEAYLGQGAAARLEAAYG